VDLLPTLPPLADLGVFLAATAIIWVAGVFLSKTAGRTHPY